MVAIFILAPGTKEAKLQGFQGVLRLNFTDAVTAVNEETELFDQKFARQNVDFLDLYHKVAGDFDLLIHCQAGVSRSAVVAVWAASELGLPLTGYFAMLNPFVLQQLVRCKSPRFEYDGHFEKRTIRRNFNNQVWSETRLVNQFSGK